MDFDAKMRILLLACCLAAVHVVRADSSGLLVTFPKFALFNSTLKICFTSLGLEGERTINVSAEITFARLPGERQSRTCLTRSDGERWTGTETDACLDVQVSCLDEENNSITPLSLHLSLSVNGRTTSEDRFRKTYDKVISVRRQTRKTFIQTDKPIYQPGQKVLFRFLTVTYPDLVPDTESVWHVTVSSPSGTRLQQWRHLVNPNGLIDLDFQLTSSEAELGTWQIKARDQSGTVTAQPFSVEEYVLPKFDVQITPPPYLYRRYEGEVIIKVCAKYTYGQPVRGRILANVSVDPEIQTRRFTPRPVVPVEVVANDSTGCADISVHSSRLKVNAVKDPITRRRYSNSDLRLSVQANFTESGTGVSLAGSSSTKVTNSEYKLELRAPGTFKPGLPYRGKVIVTRPDATPVSGHDVRVFVGSVGTQKITTGPDGVADFTSTVPYDPFTTDMVVRARMRDVDSKIKRSVTIRSWYSPSSSFLDALTTITRATPGQSIPVSLTFTLPRAENIMEIQFFYRVVSSGRIVTNGKQLCTWAETEIPVTGDVAVEIEVRTEHGADTSGIQRHALRQAQRMSASGRSRGWQKRQWSPHPRSSSSTRRRENNPINPDLTPYESVDIKQCQLLIDVVPSMSPTSQVLVYYIRSDGEVVSATTTFTMAPYFENQVSVEFLEGREVRPGHPVSIAVTAQPSSLCAFGVVDKSVHIMSGNNQLTKAKVFAPMSDLNEIPGSLNRTCPTQANTRIITATTRHVDSAEAFRKSGLSIATDFSIETRPCWLTERQLCRGWLCDDFAPVRFHFMADVHNKRGLIVPLTTSVNVRNDMMRMNIQERADVHVQEELELDEEPQPLVELRSYFPETWLWKLAPVGLDGRHVTREEIPHTITDWVASAFCLSSDRGVGVAESASIRAFQPFFLSYTLPYSVIRGEKVPVKVTVFNYLTMCLSIELSLSESTNYSVEARPESEIVEVCGNSAETLSYEIVPIELGEIPIRVDAIARSNNVLESPVSDAIQDTIIVEPEGAEREETFSELICPADDVDGLYLASVPLRLPSLVVPGSARGRIQVIGDIMGPVMSNLDSLLRMPTGCGEQNMILMAPNIFVMQYLSSTAQLTTSIQEKALAFMRRGYQRELTYQLRDASYSAFGESDREGSTWLTAFVLRCFAQAKDFMDIDESDLARTRQWLARNRRDAMGCVVKRGRVIHKEMQGAVSSPVTLTAFVTSALLEAGASPWDDSVTAGLDCIQHWMDNTEEAKMDTYTLAISSYALGLAHAYDTQADCIYYLENRMQGDLNVGYWSNSDVSETEETLCIDHCHAPSSDIEVTAYALLGYLNQDPDREFNALLTKTMPIVKWLNSQRNGFGGFSSTQDTVVGLQALTLFAEVVYDPDSLLALNISVDATRTPPAEAQVRNLTVSNNNRLILQREELAEVPTELTVTATGSGCALFQAELRYNVPVLLPNRLLFNITVSVEDADSNAIPNPVVCGDKKVTVCVKYTGSGEETNMAVIEMKMVSGYIPHEDSLEMMQSEIGAQLGLKRIDKYENGKPLALYFDQFDATTRCVPIQLKQEIVVKETKDAVIKVYDYYKPGVVGFKRYNTCEDQQ